MTEPTVDSSPRDLPGPDGRRQRRCRASWQAVVCAALGAVLLACSGDSGGGSGNVGGGGGGGVSGGSGDPPLATEPVDLPPGQTVAKITWQPSRGRVANYLVFVSRNGGSFDFDHAVTETTARIEGVPGDEVRITVMAADVDGNLSDASHPSPPIRFRAAAPQEVVATDPPVISPSNGSVSSPDPTPPPTPAAGAEPSSSGSTAPADGSLAGDATPPVDASPAPPPASTDGQTGATADGSVLTPTLRTRLLLMDIRQPLTGLETQAAAWIQSWVESEIATGIELIATARRPLDAMRDLVWQDATGQLFHAEGPRFAVAEDPAATLVPTLQLLAGERFVDLVDIDGDGLRDWVVEDTTTGSAWFRPDAASPAAPARAAHQPETERLLGSGDFDGDGRVELLWQDEDGSLAFARPTTEAPALVAGAAPPAGSRIVAVADLTGDGSDDLIARSEDGMLALGITTSSPDGGVSVEWSEGHAEADASVELGATLDLDSDGRAELAWLTDGIVEIRAIGEATPRAFEF